MVEEQLQEIKNALAIAREHGREAEVVFVFLEIWEQHNYDVTGVNHDAIWDRALQKLGLPTVESLGIPKPMGEKKSLD